MNLKLVTFIGLTSVTVYLNAEYGCMAKSYHLSQLNDPKEYHYVTGPDGGPCPCPCSRYCSEYKQPFCRGQCPVCGHYRVPRPFIIVKSPKKAPIRIPSREINVKKSKPLHVSLVTPTHSAKLQKSK